MTLAKRIFDIVAAILALVILSPLMLGLALTVLITLGPPVLFRQTRAGFKGRPFVLYKFRTMREVAASDGHPAADADRLTPLGQFLRTLSLDELPELVNILRGDMSFVGPRPLLLEYLPLYSAEQARRHDAVPGLTGWAQVHGRNAVDWQQKFRLDVWYVEHRSFVLDMKIILQTFGAVFRREGISQAGHVTSDYFTGNKD